MEKNDIKLIDTEKLKAIMTSNGFKAYRASQIQHAIWKEGANTFEMMPIPLNLKDFLKKHFYIYTCKVINKSSSKDGTIKFLLEFLNKTYIETVFIPSSSHNTQCISSQSGCKMRCRFCATGESGFKRDLSAGEIIEQILIIQKLTGESIGNIVVMGMGEPFENYNNLMQAIRIINSKHALNIGARRITVSTVGIPEAIKRFADENIQARLSISLHASENSLRSQIVPINKKYPIEDILKACRYYNKKAKKYVSFEYILLKGINDSEKHAISLSKRLKGWKCRVNLIPYNPVNSSEFMRSDNGQIKTFSNILKKFGINTTIRKERGVDIKAACGQLKSSFLKNKNT
ncbi:MAG: 23S rRNA (adenine(2503)-C(2))-methyltransferase RlmN [Candidatus Aureabacteria bacterium]|nr:23S rRNA (adenine(2503)-C(2))-methyltransferase RlmN [Candidatus Auribacterota bacterium]